VVHRMFIPSRIVRQFAAALTLVLAAACSDQIVPTGITAPQAARHAVTPTDLALISAGGNHACALRPAGTTICWGDNSSGQLNVPAGLAGVTKISAGGAHTCAIKAAGALVCWGDDSNGQIDVPADLGPVSDVSSGSSTTCAIRTTGFVRCWGWDYNGLVSGPATFGRPVRAVSVNYTSTCVIAADDSTIHCWGANDDGGLNAPAGQFTTVAMAAWGGCALAADGSLPCWGYGVPGWFTPPAGTFTQLSAAPYEACALSLANVATCWGMTMSGTYSNVAQVGAGGGFACVVYLTGGIGCFRGNSYESRVMAVPPEFGGPIPPTVTAGGPYVGLPNVPVTLTATIADPGHSSPGVYWTVDGFVDSDIGAPLRFPGTTTAISFPSAGTYTAHFNAETYFGIYQSSVTVTISANAAPVMNALPAGTMTTAGVFTATGTFTDPSSSSWTATANYGDGTGVLPVPVSGNTYTLSHQFAAAGTFSILVTLTDNQGLSSTTTRTVTATNGAAKIASLPSASLPVGNTYTADGSFTDAGSKSWTATVNYGDGSGTSTLHLSGKTFTLSHIYYGVGTYTVTIQVTDNQGAVATATSSVTVQGAAASTATLASQVTQLATAGLMTPAAATAINKSLTAVAAAIAAGDKTAASVGLAAVGITINNEFGAGRMSSATAILIGQAMIGIARAVWGGVP
jgi:hypothetical protein